MPDETFTPDGTPEPTDAPAVEGPWSPPQDEWNQIRSFVGAAAPVLGQLAQAMHGRQEQQPMQQPQAPQAPQQAEPEFDPWEPSSVRNYVQAEIQRGVAQGIEQHLGAYEPLLESVASTEGERQARMALDSLNEEIGEFDQDAAMILAAGLMSHGNVMPDHALRSSAQYLHEMEARVRADERERVLNQQREVAGAPSEHPVGGSPVAAEMETVPTGARRYHEALERAIARRNASIPVG